MSIFKNIKITKTAAVIMACCLLITPLIVGSSAIENPSGFVYMSSDAARVSNYAASTVTRWAKNALALSDVDDTEAAGLNYSFLSKSKEATHFEGVRDDLKFNGLTLRFSGLEADTASNATFTVRFSDNTSSGVSSSGKLSNGVYTYLAVVLNSEDGTLTAKYNNKSELIISDNALKLDNLKNSEFSYYFEFNDDDGANVKVTVGDTVLNGEISHDAFDYLKNTAKTYTNYEKTSVLIGPGKDSAVFKLTFVGYQNGMDITDTFLSGLKKLSVNSTRMASQSATIGAWKANFLREDLSNGGIRITCNNAIVEQRDGIHSNVSLNGLFLQFSRFITDDTKNKLMLRISDGFNNNGYDAWCKGEIDGDGIFTFLGIVLDTESGELIAKAGGESEVIIADEALKYSNISRARFSLHFIRNSDESFKLYMVVGGKSLEGTVSANIISKATALTDYKRCGILVCAAEDSSSFVTNFIGYKTGVRRVDTTTVITAINNIGTVSLDNLSAVREARALYNELSDDNKSQVTNVDILEKAEQTVYELAAEADKNLTYVNKSGLRLSGHSNPSVSDTINKNWANQIKMTDISTGGVHIAFTDAIAGIRDGLKTKVNLNGLTLLFDNFYSEEGNDAYFTVFFGNGDEDWGCDTNGSVALTLNPNEGTITAYPSGEVVIKNDWLLADSLKYQRMVYEFVDNEDGTFTMNVKLRGQVLSGVIDDSMKSGSQYLSNTNSCMMGFSNVATSTYSIDFVGYRSVDSLYVGNVKTTIKQIDSIGKVNINNALPIRKARYMYESLTDEDKLLVTNYSTLVNAENKFYELCAIEDLRLEYYTSSNFLLYDEDLFYGVWKKNFTLKPLSTGGTRFVFDNAIRNIRQGITAKEGLSGFKMQFDNITANNASACTFMIVIGSDSVNGWGPDFRDNLVGEYYDFPMYLVMDTENGRIIAKTVVDETLCDTVIIENDILKIDNIKLQRFSYAFKLIDNKDYELTVTVGDKSAKGIITNEIIKRTALYDCIDTTCHINITNFQTATYTFDFIGFYNSNYDSIINAVIEAIDALPKVITEDDIEDVRAVEDMYIALQYKHRRIIANYPVLQAALNQVYKLESEDLSWADDMPLKTNGKPLYGEESIP